MKYTIYVSSELDGLLYHNGTYCESLCSFSKEIKFTIDTIEDNVFSFYPIENNKFSTFKLLPYSIDIKCQDCNLFCDSNYVKLVKYSNGIYDLIFMPNLLYYKNKSEILKKLTLDIGVIELRINTYGFMYLTLNDKQYTFNCKHNLQEVYFYKHEIDSTTYVLVSATIEKYEYLCIFFVDKNGLQKLAEFLADKIEIKSNILSILTKKNDMAKHAIVTKYKMHQNSIMKTERFLTSLKHNFTINNIKLIPFAFLEAIQVSNFDLARTYLTESTSASLSNEHLKTYFGNIYDIKQPHIESENIVAVITSVDNSFVGKYFKFTFKDNKIDNINEI